MRFALIVPLQLLLIIGICEDSRADQPAIAAAADSKPVANSETKPKLPVPPDDAQKASLALIRDVYKADYEKATTPARKLELAKKLLQEGAQTEGDASGKFVLLRVSRDLAILGGDTELALHAVDAIAKSFQIDTVDMKLQALTQIEKSVATPLGHKQVAAAFGQLIDEAIAAEDFTRAKQLSEREVAACRAANDAALVKESVARGLEIDRIAALYVDVVKARATLKSNPLDPGANFLVGKFLCFYQGDWDGGLPMLALGNDPKMKGIATTELKPPTNGAARAALADAWWDAAEKATGSIRNRMQARAIYWYKLAIPELAGLPKAKAEKRIDEVASLGGASGANGKQAGHDVAGRPSSSKPAGTKTEPNSTYECLLGVYFNDGKPTPFVNLGIPNGSNMLSQEVLNAMQGKLPGEISYAATGYITIPRDGTYEFDQNFGDVSVDGRRLGFDRNLGTIDLRKGVHRLGLHEGNHGQPYLPKCKIKIREKGSSDTIPIVNSGRDIQAFLNTAIVGGRPIVIGGFDPAAQKIELKKAR